MNSEQLRRLIVETYGGGPTDSGVTVNSGSAMRLITVQNCVRMRSSTLSRLPCHMMEKQGENKEKAEDFYLYEKLLHQPNSWMSAPEFWGMAEAYVSLRGNFVAYKAQLPGRPIRELIPIPINPGADTLSGGLIHQTGLSQITQNEDYSLDYEIRLKNGEIKHLNETQVLHLRGMTLNGYTGLNPIEYAREAIGKGIASEKHLARWFAKGLHPSAVIRHPQPLSGPAFANRREALKERYEGLGKSHEFMLLDEAMEISFPEIKLVDAQFLEQMKLTEAQICGMFRVPLMLVNGGDKSPTYASSEQFMLFYQMFSIDCGVYESAIRRDLLTEEERKRYYAKFELRALQRGSFKEQTEGIQTLINCEVMNPNQGRELFDWNPYPGGDEYRTRTSTTKDTTKEPAKKGEEE
ncbi:MAG: phage portal protein [Sphaerochaeta sp.]|nr:phage portal protein [Sphaerochaeta sp.]